MPDDPIAPQNPPPYQAPPAAPPGTPPPYEAPLATPPGMPPPAGATSPGLTPNVAAGIAVIFTFISGIIFLVIEKHSQYVRFWAMQATIFGLIWLVVRIVLGMLLYATLSSTALFSLVGVISLLINLAFFIVWVIMIYFAFTGKEWEIPGLGKFARQQLVKFPPKP